MWKYSEWSDTDPEAPGLTGYAREQRIYQRRAQALKRRAWLRRIARLRRVPRRVGGAGRGCIPARRHMKPSSSLASSESISMPHIGSQTSSTWT